MKAKGLFSFIFIFIFVTVCLGKELEKPKGPKALIFSTEYDFGTVVEGTQVLHNFVIKNIGDAPLHIKGVGTECGCTTVSYTKTILPGSAGEVSVKVDTNGFADLKIRKNVIVTLDDIKHSPIVLTISGDVKSFAYIIPKRVVLKGASDKKIEKEVVILPRKEYPFRITSIHARYGRYIKYKLREIRKGSRSTGYRLIVRNVAKIKGRYSDRIYLKTDSKIKPVIEIRVYGDII